jgi:hypothetical protein
VLSITYVGMAGMYLHGGISGAALASGPLRKSIFTGLLIAAVVLTAPAGAVAQATLTVDEVAPCYREQSTLHLVGGGFTQNGPVVFTRDGSPIGDPIVATAAGELFPQLILPGLISDQKRLTYVATDQANPALSAQVSLLVTATDVSLRPEGGASHRLLTINARGFFEGSTLYAHVVRSGRRPGKARNLRIGRIKGSCKKVEARRRLFSKGTAPGKYRVQFDTFRRFKSKRAIETEFIVTVYPTAGTARATALSPAS